MPTSSLLIIHYVQSLGSYFQAAGMHCTQINNSSCAVIRLLLSGSCDALHPDIYSPLAQFLHPDIVLLSLQRSMTNKHMEKHLLFMTTVHTTIHQCLARYTNLMWKYYTGMYIY